MLRVIFLGALRGVMGKVANGWDGVDGSGMALAMLSVFSEFFSLLWPNVVTILSKNLSVSFTLSTITFFNHISREI